MSQEPGAKRRDIKGAALEDSVYRNDIERTGEAVPASLLVVISSLMGLLACLGDIVMTYLLGLLYHGYNSLSQPMSDLGDGNSPVARLASNWWIILGLLFVVFGYGFYRAFSHQGKMARRAAWMIAVYGLGEGLGSGLVPGTPGNNFLTLNSIAHNMVSGFGVIAVMLLPFTIMKLYDARHSPYLYWYSWFTTILGTFFFVLFAISVFYQHGWLSYTGLWQRLWVLMYYFFLMCLAVLMLRRRKAA